jgi:hypothetical protein
MIKYDTFLNFYFFMHIISLLAFHDLIYWRVFFWDKHVFMILYLILMGDFLSR